jgi:uncharacterized repeat protein (TIGR03806 family)
VEKTRSLLFSMMLFFLAPLPAPVLGQFGIDVRVSNTTLLIENLPSGIPGSMQVARVFDQLNFIFPVLLIEIPDQSGRLALVEKTGRIYVFPKITNPGPGDVTLFLDISGRVVSRGEQGLLGLAFDPDYASTGEFYVYYSWNASDPGTSRVSRFTNPTPSGNSADAFSEEILLELPQPFTNHNAGMLTFGPDNMLYIALGDGGSGGDPLDNGQDTTTLFGSILRIDVNSTPDPGLNYQVPVDNPFYVSGPAGPLTRKEIYAYGFRNPWRFSFDAVNGFLLAGDVGQNTREEIDAVYAGGNYGWRVMEGTLCFASQTCDQTGLIPPLADYGRTDGSSVTGGYVYFGSQVPDLYGMYIYGDYASGRIWGLRYDGLSVQGPFVLVDASGLNISSFGQDSSGEVYILDLTGGGIFVLRPSSPPGSSSFPTRLSDIPALLNAGGGVDQTNNGIIPYTPSAKLWSDGVLKERFIALPDLTQIGYREDTGWDFPEQSAIIKNFIMPMDERNPSGTAKRIETRMLYRKNGQWHGFSYEWDAYEQNGFLLGSDKTKRYTITDKNGRPVTIDYLFPSRSQCIQCHTSAANGVLGLNTPQMNTDLLYPASGVKDNQLRTYDHIELFMPPSLPDVPDNLPRMPDPADTDASFQDRARAYLSANCSMCHRPGGTAPTNLDLRWGITNQQMNAVNIAPGNGDFGISNARIISSTNVYSSILLYRMGLRDRLYQMPPLATSRVDSEGYNLIHNWILSFQGPSASTHHATEVSNTSAVLNAAINPRGIDTNYYFEYWIDPQFKTSTPVESAGFGLNPIAVNESIPGLLTDTKYHFQVRAENNAAAVTGGIKSFTTRILYVQAPPGDCGGNTPCFSTISDALDSLQQGQDTVILIDDQVYTENVFIENNHFVTFIGGWDSAFSNYQGTTKINGTIYIHSGSALSLEGAVIE